MKTMKKTFIVVVFLISNVVVFSQNQYDLSAFVKGMEWWVPYAEWQTQYRGDIKPVVEINSSYNGLVYNSSINYIKLGGVICMRV